MSVGGVGAASDPYYLTAANELPTLPNYRNISGLTQVDPRIVGGETTATFVTLGQSNAPGVCYTDTQYTPTHPTKVQMLNVYDGGLYLAKDPMLGQNGLTGGSWMSRTADKLITAGKYARVICAAVDQGASAADQWAPTGILYPRLLAIAKRCAAVGLPITAFIWHQGETDGVNGTSSAAYQASVNAMITAIRAAGFSSPWLIGKCTYFAGVTYATIQGAQDALVNTGAQIYAGPNTDTLTGTTVNRQADNSHLKAAGADAAAGLLSTIIQAVL